MTRLMFALVIVATVEAPAEAQDEPPARVFVVGDSHVFQLGPALSRLLEEDGIEVEGWESRHGWSTARYREAGDLREVLELNGSPEVVVISLGGNDFVRSEEQYRRQLTWIVEEARSAGALEIVWLGPATSDVDRGELAEITAARHERNAELQAEILPELGVHWVDSRPVTYEGHAHDGVHFTRSGYHTWACGVCEAIFVMVVRASKEEE